MGADRVAPSRPAPLSSGHRIKVSWCIAKIGDGERTERVWTLPGQVPLTMPTYIITARRMISGLVRKQRKGLRWVMRGRVAGALPRSS